MPVGNVRQWGTRSRCAVSPGTTMKRRAETSKHATNVTDARWTGGRHDRRVTPQVPPRPLIERRTRPLTVVLRAVPNAAIEGRLAGRAEIVDTGESIPIRNVGDLMDLLARLAAEQAEIDE
jgi:hypothetical protein